MLAITAINGIFLILMVAYTPQANALEKCFDGGSFEMSVTKNGGGAPTSEGCTKACMNETKADGTEFKCEDLADGYELNKCKTDGGSTKCYCDEDNCNAESPQIPCHFKENATALDQKTTVDCQQGIVNCKQVKKMVDRAVTQHELSCGNTNGDEMKLGCTKDGDVETCFCKGDNCNTGTNTWPNNSSSRQLIISNLAIALSLGFVLFRKCE